MDFKVLKNAISNKFAKMSKSQLYYVTLDKDELYNLYLDSFPEGTNEIYRERREYDCSCCRHFIKTIGNLVTIDNNYNIDSIWNCDVKDPNYKIVTDKLYEYVKSKAIENLFIYNTNFVGTDKNFEQLMDKSIKTWEHFFVNIPDKFIKHNDDIGTYHSQKKSSFNVCYRGLTELTLESINIVLELISQNSLYRGEEHKFVLTEFKKYKIEFDKIKENNKKNNYIWTLVPNVSDSILRIRNSAIGTLLIDLSNDVDLEQAVSAFERVVAPENYKRTTSLITKKMIEDAKNKINELGFTSALQRRFAKLDDITINNVLYADKSIKRILEKDVFDVIAEDISSNINKKTLNKVEEILIEDFIKDVLPNINSMEIMVDNKHANNFVSLIAPQDSTSKNMFKWNNNFSWSYIGEMTDSIKQRVKSAGGNVDADVCCRLSWFNYDDLDLHMIEPDGTHISYSNKKSKYGQLDVDMNAGGGTSRTPVENIYYQNKNFMCEGNYKLFVNNYCKRENVDFGFVVEFEFMGNTKTFTYNKPIKTDERVIVVEFKYSKKHGIEIINGLQSEERSKKIWNINTMDFHKVNSIMMSPNYWDEFNTGNKHYFFMINNCINDGSARGFYNEFLKSELDPYRKVLEFVGGKLLMDNSNEQLSGLGFSSTKSDNVIVRVSGNFNRILDIVF